MYFHTGLAKGGEEVKACELSTAVCDLRNHVQLLRRVALSSNGPRDCSHPTVKNLARQTALRAREVEAWGDQLKEPRALAAAQEAYQVLAKANSPAGDHRPKWAKAGAVVMVQVEHDCTMDPNQLVKRLVPATLDMVLTEPPCPRLDASVGLLSISDLALLEWARRVPLPRTR